MPLTNLCMNYQEQRRREEAERQRIQNHNAQVALANARATGRRVAQHNITQATQANATMHNHLINK